MEIVRLENVGKCYGERVILRAVNLAVEAGEFMVLNGESGTGKSTLLNIIGGLEVATSGLVLVDGKDIGQMAKKERANFYRHEVGIIFQGSYLQAELSLMENIGLPGVFSGMPVRKREQRVQELAQILGIAESLRRTPAEVSGGQAERACIARALLLGPKIILADEPTSNLDESNAKIVLRILDYVRQKLGVTIIMSSHSPVASSFATQLWRMKNGAPIRVDSVGNRDAVENTDSFLIKGVADGIVGGF